MEENLNIFASFWHDLVELDYWRRAVIGGVVVAAVCSLLSVYAVLRRMAFIGQGISHSALGGFALGMLVFGAEAASSLKVDVVALGFCLVVAALIGITTRHSKISEDSAIGIFFVASMALGVVFMHMTPGFAKDVYSFLFGSPFLITREHLIGSFVMATLVILPLVLLQKELLYYTFDQEMAGVSGVPVNVLHFLLLGLLTVTIIISSRIVGILLVSAFLILPGATAQLLSQKFQRMVVLSIVTGVGTTLIGLFVAHVIDVPSGAAVVLVQVAVFGIVFAIRKVQGLVSV